MTITLTREEAQQVLDALDEYRDSTEDFRVANRCISLIETLRARLAQPEQRTGDCLLTGVCAAEGHRIQKAQPEPEPVAWLYVEGLEALKAGKCWTAYGTKQDDDCRFPVYTATPQR